MVETQSDTNTALANLAKASLEGLQQLQQDFAVAKQAFQDQLMRDLESSTARMHSYFERMMSGLDSAFQATLSKVKSTMTAVQSDMGSLSKVRYTQSISNLAISRSNITLECQCSQGCVRRH